MLNFLQQLLPHLKHDETAGFSNLAAVLINEKLARSQQRKGRGVGEPRIRDTFAFRRLREVSTPR